MADLNFNLSALLIGCIVAFLPLYIRISSVDISRVSRSNALICLIPAILILFNKRERIFPLYLKIISIAAILHLIAVQYEPALFNGVYQAIAISSGLLFLVKYQESYSDNDNNIIFNFLCAGAVIQSVITLFQYLGFDIYEYFIMSFNSNVSAEGPATEGHVAFFGSLQNKNILGSYLALCLPAFFRNKLLMLLSIPVVISIILSDSLMPIAASIISISYYLFAKTKKREALYYIVIPIMFYSFCILFPDKTSDRYAIWENYISKITTKSFLIGNSTSWLTHNAMDLRTGFVDNIHNEFLTAFNIFGIAAIAAIVYIVYLVVSNTGKNRIFGSMLISSFLLMSGNFPLHIAPTAFIILIALAHCIKGNYGSNLDW